MLGSMKSGLQVSVLALLPFLTAGSNAHAQWTGGIEGGTQLGSGENPTLRFFARNNSRPFSQYVYLDWTRQSSGQSFRLGYNPLYYFSNTLYGFGNFTAEQDADSLVEQEFDALAGIGKQFLQTSSTSLALEAGLGAQQLRFEDSELDDQTDGFVYLGGKFSQKLFDLFRFNLIVDNRTGSSENIFEAEAGISIRLAANTALKYSYRFQRIDFDDDGLPSVTDEDNFFTVTYGF